MSRAADRVIVQVDQVIANEQVRSDPWKTTIADADAIVRAPICARIRSMRAAITSRTMSTSSSIAMRRIGQQPAIASRFEQYLDRYCRNPPTHSDYLELIGIKRLLELHEY